ncbi:uncharacterized protein LOC6034511 isoform X1 [Culex quinquefasciatus]|uniref:uncharacterized protein LOC6034511 isoform X1 n=1 Tax=Culex quinquefasciatus TaxID=7176 RepID=UPI0018E3E5F6|nr:uncharacterized protein LOC6034511 isoform X1 [Culex quinquefasciatus]
MSDKPVVCRTCRKESAAERAGGVCHLPVEAEDQHGKSVAEKIYEVTDVMVRLDHSLSQVICMQCVELLEIAYNFRQQVIESNNILNHCKLGMLAIKEEPIDPCEVKLEGDSENETGGVPQSSSKRPFRSTSPKLPVKMARKSTTSTNSSTDKSKNKSRKLFARMALENVKEVNGRIHCRIDEFNPCAYAPKTFDSCNFIRHFRKQHRDIAKLKGFFRDAERGEEQKPRSSSEKKQTQVKLKVALSVQKVIEGCLRLVAEHNFPLNGFDWAGFRLLLEGLALNVNEAQVRKYLSRAAGLIVERIVKEMAGRMISIKIDSGCLNERHILTVTALFELHNVVMCRVLGTVEVAPDDSPEQIKHQVLDVVRRYNVSVDQIYAIAWDEGAMIITSNRKLYRLASYSIQTDEVWNEFDEYDDEASVVLTRREELLESLATELKSDKFVTVRGAIHNLEQALADIVDQADPNVTAIEEFVISLRKDECRTFIESQQASLPPLWSSEQWISKYKTIHSIVKQEWFFSTLKKDFPELGKTFFQFFKTSDQIEQFTDLKSSVWQFMRDHEAAFLPLYKMIKQMQQRHQPFSEFYMQWLIAIKDLRRLTANRFSKSVTDSLTTFLNSFKQNMVFNAALYLDPRFNYFKSAVFTPELKEEVQNYIIGVWNRINALTTGIVPEKPKSGTDEDDDMDRFLTEMFGGQVDNAKQVRIDANCPLMQQLKGLEIEPRQPHNYDVWQHWVDRKETHAELAKVALVVLSAPTNVISLPATFGAFFAPDQNTSRYSSKILEDILTVKLNQPTFKKIIPIMIEVKK